MLHDKEKIDTSTIEVVNGKKSYEWDEHGLKLELPAECTAKFSLNTVSSNKFNLPENTEQLSPVYRIESEGELGGPVKLELQHSTYVTEDDQQHGLKFAVSKMEFGKSSCEFDLHEGQFDIGSYGKLEINNLKAARVAIIQSEPATGPCQILQASFFYQQVSKHKYMINFVVVPRQKAWEKVQINVSRMHGSIIIMFYT